MAMNVAVLTVFVGLSVAGCRHVDNAFVIVGETSKAPRHSVAAIRMQAEEVARLQGKDIREYKPPRIIFYSDKARWYMYFEGTNNVLGNHFMIGVDDTTARATFADGM
jgi:hypothetical protein